MARLDYIITFFVFLKVSEQRSTPQDDSYVAAVLEYQASSNVDLNLQNYLQFIQEAAEKDADVVVFPEMTLTQGTRSVLVPIQGLLKEHPIPALEPELFDEMLVALSNASKQHEVYAVVNVQEVLDCTNPSDEFCPEEKTYLFNTNVVFDRNGAIIDRFRKINLFGEFTRTPALQPDLGIFTTDFGVTFGHYICFDLKFQVPAIQIVQKYNLTDIIFTTMWYSELPYLSATQIQEAYAYSMNVNFLASGANNVRIGSAGSGIYSGKAEALVSIMPGVPTTRLLVARVPKVPGQVTGITPGPIYDDPKDHDSLWLLNDPSLPSHITRLLDQGYQEFTLVDKEVTCRFQVRINLRDGETHYRYRASAFSGVRTYSGLASGGTRICSIFVCSGESIDSCSRRLPQYIENTTAIFEELTIVGTFPTPIIDPIVEAADSVFFPVSLGVSIMPLEPQEFSYTEDRQDNFTVYTMTLTNKEAEIYSFAIWGRVFASDGEDPSPPVAADENSEDHSPGAPGSSTIHLSNIFLIIYFVLILLK